MTFDVYAAERIETLEETHENAIPVLGSAIFAATALKNGDWETFLGFLSKVPGNTRFYKFSPGVKKALELFCDACLVDPKLVEAHLQTSFSEIANIYE